MRKNGGKGRVGKIALCLLLVALAAELFVFNFRHWESLGYARADLTDFDGVTATLKKGKCEIDLGDIGYNVENIYLDYELLDEDGAPSGWQAADVTFYGRDAANAGYFNMGTRRQLSAIERLRYVKINLLGETKGLKLGFETGNAYAKAVRLRRVALNAPVPLYFSPFRLIALLALLGLVAALRPGSPVYGISFDLRWRGRRAVIAAVCAALCLFMWALAMAEWPYGEEGEPVNQYHLLARSLAEGHTWLDVEPTPELLAMENPYDARLRKELVGEKGFKRDYAFYNGRYYCYFGVLPVALTYLPYHLATGGDMDTVVVLAIFGAILSAGAFALIYELFRRFYPKAPFAVYLLAASALLASAGLPFGFRGAKQYTVPIVCAAMLALWGLWFWLRASAREGGRRQAYAALGSLCVALTVLARPQFILVSAFAFPIFASDFKALFKKRADWRFWLALILPVLPVAAATMAYNHARFGSVLDFGATYNLCSGDMRVRGWKWDRLPLALYAYLFAPLDTSPVFPFMTHNRIATNYLGTTICEVKEIFGGLFTLMPGMLICFAAFSRRREGAEPMARGIARLAVLLAFAIIALDAQMAGIVARYRMDFGWLFCLAAIICCGELETRPGISGGAIRVLRTVLLGSVLVGIAYEFLALFANATDYYWHHNIYYGVKALMEFWL